MADIVSIQNNSNLPGSSGQFDLLGMLRNTALDIEGSGDYLTPGGKIDRNWMHNLLGVSNAELRERAGRAAFNKPENSAIRERYDGKYGAFAKDFGKKGQDAITTANLALTDKEGGVRRLNILGQGEKAEGLNLFDQADVDRVQGIAADSEAQKNQQTRLAENKAQTLQAQQLVQSDPTFIRQGEQIARQNAQQDFQNKLQMAGNKLELAKFQFEADQAKADREWRNKESQREWEYRNRRDRADALDDLFKVIMGSMQAFV